jgi:hypothetical protein
VKKNKAKAHFGLTWQRFGEGPLRCWITDTYVLPTIHWSTFCGGIGKIVSLHIAWLIFELTVSVEGIES